MARYLNGMLFILPGLSEDWVDLCIPLWPWRGHRDPQVVALVPPKDRSGLVFLGPNVRQTCCCARLPMRTEERRRLKIVRKMQSSCITSLHWDHWTAWVFWSSVIGCPLPFELYCDWSSDWSTNYLKDVDRTGLNIQVACNPCLNWIGGGFYSLNWVRVNSKLWECPKHDWIGRIRDGKRAEMQIFPGGKFCSSDFNRLASLYAIVYLVR